MAEDLKPLRVMMLIRELHVGGAQIAMLNLAMELQQQGCELVIYPWREGGPLESRFEQAGLKVVHHNKEVTGWGRFRVPSMLSRYVKEQRISVVHAHMSDSALWAAILSKQVPVVVSHHTVDLIDTVGEGRPLYGWMRHKLLNMSARRAHMNVAVSQAVAERLQTATGLGSDRIVVSPNGIFLPPEDLVKRDAFARAERRMHKQGPELAAVGRLSPVKGMDLLIQAFSQLQKIYAGARLNIFGDGPDAQTLKTLASDLGVGDAVQFHGFVDDVSSRLSAMDLFVSSSHVEGMPLAVLESMAAGLPVVVSDIPSHRELINHNDTGLTFPLEDLVEALHRALADWSKTECRAQAARALVGETYSVEATAQQHQDIYRQALEFA